MNFGNYSSNSKHSNSRKEVSVNNEDGIIKAQNCNSWNSGRPNRMDHSSYDPCYSDSSDCSGPPGPPGPPGSQGPVGPFIIGNFKVWGGFPVSYLKNSEKKNHYDLHFSLTLVLYQSLYL